MDDDLTISQKAEKKEIYEIASALGIEKEYVEPYGKNKAKINLKALENRSADSRLILVTAINPTKAGEGKTTCSIGLADSLSFIGKKTAIALREPSLGPVFGLKGGAAGGGYAQVVPMEDINLHFTGDIHAITSANNLICACIDNHIHFGNELDIREVTFRRCIDISDRMLRTVTTRFKDEERQDSFNITVASEIMAIFCLASDMADLRRRIDRIVIGKNSKSENVTVKDLGVTGSVAVLLQEALKPNLVQTIYHTPAFIHGGPFANIAHGCNSLLATKMAMSYADYTVTEAGFGADLGAEKFVDIKCRCGGIAPDGIVVVATIRALKMHGGVEKQNLSESNPAALEKGFGNLALHIRHMRENFGYTVPVRAALNRFPADTEEELKTFERLCEAAGIDYDHITSFRDGQQGAVSLARNMVAAIEQADIRHDKTTFPSYDLKDGLRKNIAVVAKKFYEVDRVIYSPEAEEDLNTLIRNGYDNIPVCVAKTPYALNDGGEEADAIHIQRITLSAGAGFAVLRTGSIMTMPGLPKEPMAKKIDLDASGKVVGMM